MTLYEYMDKKHEDLKNKIEYFKYTIEIEKKKSRDCDGLEANMETLQTIYCSNDLLERYAVACAIDESNKFTWSIISAQQNAHDSKEEFTRMINNMGYSVDKIHFMGFNIDTLMTIKKEELFERAKALNGLGSSEYQDIVYTGEITEESYFLFRLQSELKEKNNSSMRSL